VKFLIKVVMLTVNVGRHAGDEAHSMLFVDILTEFHASNFCIGVSLVVGSGRLS